MEKNVFDGSSIHHRPDAMNQIQPGRGANSHRELISPAVVLWHSREGGGVRVPQGNRGSYLVDRLSADPRGFVRAIGMFAQL